MGSRVGSTLAAALTIAVFCLPTSALGLPYSEGFESGLNGWTSQTTAGVCSWRVLDRPENLSVSSALNPKCVTLPDNGAHLPAAGGTHVVWFGEESTGTYIGSDYGAQSSKNGGLSATPQAGSLTSPSISLAGVAKALLEFDAWWEVEGVNGDTFDLMTVALSTDDGSSFTNIGQLNPSFATSAPYDSGFTAGGSSAMPVWRHYVYDISAYVGSTILVRFTFDTADEQYNAFRGWTIDNVAVNGGATLPAPSVTGVSPRAAQANEFVSISGANFIQGATLWLGSNEVPAAGITQFGASYATFRVPNLTAGTYDVKVVNPDGQSSTLPGAFVLSTVPSPSVTSISPSSGSLLTPKVVTLAGTSFLAGATVTVGAIPATNVTVVTANSITCTFPALPVGNFNVVVTNPSGQAGTLFAAYAVTDTSTFTVTAPNGGETWNAGSTYAITWTSSGASNISLQLFKGGSWVADLATSISAASGSFTWSLPIGLAGGSDYKVKVLNPGGASSDFSNGDFTVVPWLPPTLTVSTGTTDWLEDGAPCAVDPALLLTNPEGSNFTGMKVSISSGLVPGEDVLAFTAQGGVTGSYNSATGVLSLNGSASAATYQAILRSVTYQNVRSDDPTPGVRQISFSVGPSSLFPDNGHYYEFVSAPAITWTAARDAAALRRYFGLAGYLVTIGSAAENAFVVAKLSGEGWMGAATPASTVPRTWTWVTGPEANTDFFKQTTQYPASGGGSAISGRYNNWATGEPNNAGGENYAHFRADGRWNDFPLSVGSIAGYVVEYGGSAGDPILNLSGSKTVQVTACEANCSTCSSGTVCTSCDAGYTLSGGDCLITTVTTVVSAANPASFGTPVSFTATVVPGSAGGSVQFQIDGVNFGTPVALAAGAAVSGPANLATGSHAVTALYSGTATYAGSSDNLSQVISKAGSATALVSAPNPSTFGQAVTFTANVTPAGATGSVQFRVDGTDFGAPVALSGGTATSTPTTGLAVGPHAISATYSGDANYLASLGNTTQNVAKASASVAVASPVNPTAYGEPIAVVASISPASATGTVQFRLDGANVGGPVPLVAGVAASLPIPSPAAGTHAIDAIYSGDLSYLGANGSLVGGQSVALATTETALALAPNPSRFGQSVTVTATLAAEQGTTPTGTVTFFRAGPQVLGTANLNGGGTATLTTSSLAVGAHVITASYVGDANHLPSTSPAKTQTVVQAATTTTVTSSLNPSLHAQPVTFSVGVNAVAPGAGVPSGAVSLFDGATLVASGILASGHLDLVVDTLAVATHVMTAVYAGDAQFTGSTSPALTQRVEPSCVIAATVYAAAAPNPANPCQVCDPTASSGDWTNRAAGFACPGDALPCTSDVCDGAGTCTHPLAEGCLIGGACVASGAFGPTNECVECNPARSTAAYSPRPRGSGCADDGSTITDDICDGTGLCVHPLKNQCLIDGVTYAGGTINPSNSCQVCDALANFSGWTLRAAGSPCASDGLDCTLDVCDGGGSCGHSLFTGCLIGGACVAAGSPDPLNECRACDPARSPSAYSVKPQGLACTDDGQPNTLDLCDGAGSCVHPLMGLCTIGGITYGAGAANPANPCQSCDPAASVSAWTDRVAGFPCTSDGLACTNDVCNGAGSCRHDLFAGCLIDGACVGAGAQDPTMECQECNPALSTSAYRPKARGVACADDGLANTLDQCDGASACVHPLRGQCIIAGLTYNAGAANPANPCESCDPASSTSAWTDRVAGFPCTSDGLACTDDVCDGAGLCRHDLFTGCLIGGACVSGSAQDPTNECQECNPALSTSAYSAKARGVACSDDGAANTLDVCDGAAACTHPLKGQCMIAGISFDAGTANPANACESCDPAASTTAWTARVAGFPCASDGLTCTNDTCDGSGSCRHDLFTGCLIGGACVAAGSADPANECRECNPALSTSEFRARAAGVVCADDTLPNTMDICDGAAACIHPFKGQCVIGGNTFQAGVANPLNPCQSCDPVVSVSSWTDRIAGFPCTSDGLTCTDDICNGAGTCQHHLYTGCLVAGSCVAAGVQDPANECRECAPALSTSSFAARARGVACGDDGLANTVDACDGLGLCTHVLKGQCTIAGQVYDAGTANPANPCLACDPAASATAWSARVAGFPCTSDGLACTRDQCDGAGLCRHDLFTGCLVGGACVLDGATDPTNECRSCSPSVSTTAYSNKLSGVACSDDGLANTLDVCDGAAACVHPLRGQCVIGGTPFNAGAPNPANPCQSCDPAASTSAWTDRVAGFPCTSDGLACTVDACDGAGLCRHDLFTGCLIGGACVGASAQDPSNECRECNPALSTGAYSARARGVACSDDGAANTLDVCDGAASCTHPLKGQCTIGADLYDAGAANPANPCQSCDPAASTTSWTNRVSGFPCTSDGLACTDDVCSGAGSCEHHLFIGCLIGGVCVADAATDPSNECRECNPALSTSAYRAKARGVTCTDDGLPSTLDFCDGAAACVHPLGGQCIIAGQTFDAGTPNPANPCQSCDPAASATTWTDRVAGFPCTSDGLSCTLDTCDGAGSCGHHLFTGCLVGGACVGTASLDPANECRECNPALSTSAYSARARGVACSDDGLANTQDLCDGAAACVHPLTGQCTVGAAVYDAGAPNPANACQACDPAASSVGWTDRVAGFPCTSDGLACTDDACDGAGLCRHDLFTGCLIGGQCVASAAQDPMNECQECNPALSTASYRPKARGVACSDDGLANTLDQCDGAAACVHPLKGQCVIAGSTYNAGAPNPANPCQSCDPAASIGGWTDRVAGFPCTSDGLACTEDVCNGAGLCRHDLFTGCLIGGACVGAAALDPLNDCRECNPALAATAYSPRARGVTCTDDGAANTLDVCDGAALCTHPLKGQCTIGAVIYDAGTPNPANPCQSCNPATSTTAWTDRAAGFPCTSDGLACTVDTCDGSGTCGHTLFTGCLIGGSCVAAGAADPANECRECNPALSTSAFRARAAGVACTDDGQANTLDICDGAASCTHPLKGQCVIGGNLYLAGAPNPANPCQSCDPAASATAWTDRVSGFPCTSDGLACTSDVCDGVGSCQHNLISGCLIAGACVPAGATDPSAECRECNPALSTTLYRAKARGVACGDDGAANTLDACDGVGSCTHTLAGRCTIGGQGYDAGTANPLNPCEACDPAASTTTWTARVAGFPCTSDDLACTRDVCDGAGTCEHPLFTGCLITGACVGAGALDPVNDCRECNPALLATGYSNRLTGLACADDGLANTLDACDGAGACVHPLKGQCAIDEAVWDSGTANPDNPCQVCDPAASASRWTDRVAGFPCTSDGLACTADACDSAGQCQHPLASGCLVAGACVAAGAPDPENECRACIPQRSTEAYSATPRGVACRDDGEPNTLDYCDGAATCIHPLKGQCAIGGTQYDAGTANPANGCQFCDPAAGESAWTNRVAGFPCPDDALTCTLDTCDGAGQCAHPLAQDACFIAGACVAAGALDPANPCYACDPASATDRYSLRNASLDCLSVCAADSDCQAGYYCSLQVCRPQKGDAVSCSADNECLDGRCIDGACATVVMQGGCGCSAGGTSDFGAVGLVALALVLLRRRALAP